MSVALLCGGALLVVGAFLPWLTLYAGFQPYSGMIGQFGWAVFGAGVLAIAAGTLALRARPLWLDRLGVVFGCVLTAFTVWLLQGLDDIVHRPDTVMLVPRAGPGLYVALAGATAIALGCAVQYAIDAGRIETERLGGQL